jgi:tRNA threonylcarbamoyladenosine biosynthesis protein TsaE
MTQPRTITVTTNCPEQTQAVGRCLAGELACGDVLALHGELGSGKTCFVQGLASGLKVAGRVASPTFIVMRRHPAQAQSPTLFHVDAYRLTSGNELLDLGFEDWLGEGLVAIEWAERVQDALPEDALAVHLAIVGERHTLTFAARGRRSAELLEHLKRCGY